MPQPLQMLMTLIERSPRFNEMVMLNPVNRNAWDALKNGDEAKGKEIAMNLCESHGVPINSEEDAIKQAKQIQQSFMSHPMFGQNRPF